MKKVQDPTKYFFKQAHQTQSGLPSPQVQEFVNRIIDLEKCPLCRSKYDLEEGKIPRILIHCGHTFCEACLSHYHMNKRVRCPMCLKLVKKVYAISALPINHTIYELLRGSDERQSTTRKDLYSAFIREVSANSCKIAPPKMDEESKLQFCVFHPHKVEHFFCVFHENPGCRKCMENAHKLEGCKVLDLYSLQAEGEKGDDDMLADIEKDIQEMNV